MTSRRRVLTVLFVLWVVPLSVALGIGFWVSNAGTIAIHVDEHGPGGSNVNIRLPAAMVLAALPFVPSVVCEEAEGEFEQWGPLVRVLCNELEDMGDGVLVEVSGRHENVSIVKKGRHLVIDCKSDDETVHVSLPIGTVSAVLSKFERCEVKRISRIDTHRIIHRSITGRDRIVLRNI